MRQVKLIYIESLPNGVQEMEDKINETLREIDSDNGTVKNIAYNSVDTVGRVNSVAIEYDV